MRIYTEKNFTTQLRNMTYCDKIMSSLSGNTGNEGIIYNTKERE